ncbi:MAG: replicative DNA helicase [Polyangiales bacterium]
MSRQHRPRVEYRDRAVDLGGRTLPHNGEAEAAVIASCLAPDGAAIDDVLIVLRDPAAFYDNANQRIFRVIVDLHAAGKPIDTTTVGTELRARGELQAAGGFGHLASLVDATPSVVHAAAHARIVADHARMRAAIELCQIGAAEGYDPGVDADEFVDVLASKACALAETSRVTSGVLAYDLMRECAERISMDRDSIAGYPTGLRVLDELTGGVFPGELTILAARPGVGKTSLMLDQAVALAAHPPIDDDCEGYAVHVFSLEMPRGQLGDRMVCARGSIDSAAIRRRRMTTDERDAYVGAANELSQLPLWIYDSPGASVIDVRAHVRGAQRRATRRRHVVFIDYVQLMRGERNNGDSREQEVSGITRGLKALAKDLNVPVVALSQLNRSVETRSAKDKRPSLSDLRESGAIEQDADVVQFIYREEYYDAQEWNRGAAEIIVAKQRNGGPGEAVVAFRGPFTRFENPNESDLRRWSEKPSNDAGSRRTSAPRPSSTRWSGRRDAAPPPPPRAYGGDE